MRKIMKYVFVSEDLYKALEEKLKASYTLVTLAANDKCYLAVAKHSDIQMINIDGRLYVDDSLYDEFPVDLKKHTQVRFIKSQLGNRYPLSVSFNASVFSHVLIHNTNYTAKQVLSDPSIKEKIHVKQGYTNCSLCMLKETIGITSDKGIYKSLSRLDYKILLIKEGYIHLKDMKHGFIGGCIGVTKDKVYVNGDLNRHPDGDAMIDLIQACNLKLIQVDGKDLVDIGSMVFWQAKSLSQA